MICLPEIWALLSSALAADEAISGVWLGGSYSRGNADEFSDIDLAVQAPEDWTPTALKGLWLAYQSHRLGKAPFFHGILSDGTVLDLLVVSEAPTGYVPLPLGAPAIAPEGTPEPLGLATDFWINSYKHRKVLARGLEAMAVFGLNHERVILLRLWALLDTGTDPGPGAGTIHGMTPLIRDHVSGERRELLGLPCRNAEEVRAAILAHRREVASIGREIESRYGLPYPARLEAVVTRSSL